MNQDLQFSIRLKRALLIAACLFTLAFPLSTRMAAQTVTQVAAGITQSLFVKSDGSLWGTGDNNYGQLGLGFGFTQTNLPQEIVNSNVTAVSTTGYHVLFLESNESLWAMGYNAWGQLGDGTTNNHYFPEEIVSSGVTGLAAGGTHSLFSTVTFQRELGDEFGYWVMGDNNYGQLGDGTQTEHDSPEELINTPLFEAEVIATAAGGDFSLYVREDGSLWGSGYNADGELGDGTPTDRLSYEEIVSNNVVAVAAGVYHTLFIKSGGGLWGMGDDSQGELGDNSLADKYSPEQIGDNVTTIAAGFNFSLFIESDGTLWAMGANGYGQLGDGTTTERLLPVLISSNVVGIVAGAYDSFFIKSDGTLWAMGYNLNGQLGDGTYADRLTPVQVVPLIIPQPTITRISLVNKNLVLSGTNGESGRNYYTLMSTNLALPLNQWIPVATNFLSTDGAFTITATNAVNPNAAQAFYVLQAQ